MILLAPSIVMRRGCGDSVPAHMRRWLNVGLLLAHRLRRCNISNIILIEEDIFGKDKFKHEHMQM